MAIKVYSDGATIGHNGKMGTVTKVRLGVHMITYRGVFNFSVETDGKSNNEAEFKALILAMKICLARDERNVKFYTDSMVVCNRANGRRPSGKAKNERMDEFQKQVIKLKSKFESVSFSWVPRTQNKEADKLTRRNIDLWDIDNGKLQRITI